MIENIDFTDPLLQIASVVLGVVVLIMGRRIFWLTVGAVGFLISLALVINILEDLPTWGAVIIALFVGIIGGIVAMLLQKVAIGVAGFLMGGYTLAWLLQLFEFNLDLGEWIVFAVGGIIGAILVSFLFEVALIGISAVVGATMIVQITNFNPWVMVLLFLILLVVGITIQAKTFSL